MNIIFYIIEKRESDIYIGYVSELINWRYCNGDYVNKRCLI